MYIDMITIIHEVNSHTYNLVHALCCEYVDCVPDVIMTTSSSIRILYELTSNLSTLSCDLIRNYVTHSALKTNLYNSIVINWESRNIFLFLCQFGSLYSQELLIDFL